MHFQIKTPVQQSPQNVFVGFDRKLFMALNPPLMPLKLLRFDGCKTGDEVHLELAFGMKWISLVTDFQERDDEIFFIDEGVQLPFFLSYWRHKHRIVKDGTGTILIDDITYRSSSKIMDYLLYPVLWAQFKYRSPVYRKLFKNR
ncbi:MAG: hypothetical protein AB8B69_23715 [Chitinophagales bacterium]